MHEGNILRISGGRCTVGSVNDLGGRWTHDRDDSGVGGGNAGNTHGDEEAGKRTNKRVSRVHIDIAGPMPIASASGRIRVRRRG